MRLSWIIKERYLVTFIGNNDVIKHFYDIIDYVNRTYGVIFIRNFKVYNIIYTVLYMINDHNLKFNKIVNYIIITLIINSKHVNCL